MANELPEETRQTKNGWTVWQVRGHIDLMVADSFFAQGESVIRENPKTVLDMSLIEYISSAGLRALIRLKKYASMNGKAFTIAGAGDLVLAVLRDCRLDILLEHRASLEDL